MLSGTINIGGHEWDVSEEKRGGPQTQLFSLTALDSPGSKMQIRLGTGQEAKSLEEVELLQDDAHTVRHEAWVYIYQGPLVCARLVPDGRWPH